MNQIEEHIALVPCPDCGRLLSKSALFCPHCGFYFRKDDEIVHDIFEGDRIQVETNGVLKTGTVQKKGNFYLDLKLTDNSIYRVKFDAISSILLIPGETQVANLFHKILKIENIDMESPITTNATINECSTSQVRAITDGGKSILCFAPIGFSKKSTKIGDRLFCIGNPEKEVCYSSISNMSHNELCERFLRLLKKTDTNPIHSQHINAIISYFKFISRYKESKDIIRLLKKQIKDYTGLDKDNESADIPFQYLDNSKINSLITTHDNRERKLPRLGAAAKEFNVMTSTIVEILNKNGINIEDNRNVKLTEEMYDILLKKLSGDKKAKEESKKLDMDFYLPDSDNDNGLINKPLSKLRIIEIAKSNRILANDLPMMPESECKLVEKELDSLIRDGKREECLSKSYDVVTTKKPTSKYLRSYLDRIVNTEIALNHTEQAKEMLSVLIAFSETQKDTKANNLSHLYISLARLSIKSEDTEEAALALDWAEYINPKNNKVVSNLRQSIEIKIKLANSNVGHDDVVSGMLIQDVEQYAKTQASFDGDEDSLQSLFRTAMDVSSDNTKSYESRAQMSLDVAATYLNAGMTSKNEFKIAIANYARMKGDSLVAKISESVQQYPDSQSHLIAECDSAKSYYLEALGLYNDLAQKGYLQELLLKYLKIESLVSQVEGSKTPDAEWLKGTLKTKMRECLNDDNIESQKVLYRTCIAIGASSERVWKTLAQDEDGIGPLYGKLGRSIGFRSKAYNIINTMEKSSVDSNLAPGEFLRKIFENRQSRIKDLKKCIEECLSWDFDPFGISSFEKRWKSIVEYKELMTTTDKLALVSINDVINILMHYAELKNNERYRYLVSSQQILIKSQRMVTETTTYYGRILFFHLQEKWLKEISRQIDEKEASALPQLRILPEPRYIKLNEDGHGVIDFVVTNNSDSTAQSFVVNATINGKEYVVLHDEALSAGDSCGECIESIDFSQLESADVLFKLTAKYKGRDLPTLETEAIYEQESGDILTDIPWKIKNTPKETIFKGREGKLNTLITHYLSEERYMTYILYGLTRTGKTSILDYLCERIEGKHIKEDETKIIRAYKWSFDEKEIKNIKRSDLWANLLETNIYDKLPDELANAVDAAYHEQGLPPADKLSQSDLDIVIDALNSCNIIPLIAIDEFSYIREIIKEGLLDSTFLKKLREISYSGRACFLYAGTYDIKDIPKEYGLTGEMNNTYGMPINEIEEEYANELIDVCPNLIFDDKAKKLIRSLSGCVPYWIQWICLNCGKYAIAQRCRHLGLRDVNHVVGVMTGEIQPGKKDTWQAIDEINFYNNQMDPNNIAEQQLISSISFIVRESNHNERGVSMDELNRLWDKYNVDEFVRKNMVHALTELEKRKIVKQFTDETREVYRLNVDLFRRWWYVHHRDIGREFKL